ncbi:unnamed protein product, partial [Brassica oleracea var. botrytis]
LLVTEQREKVESYTTRSTETTAKLLLHLLHRNPIAGGAFSEVNNRRETLQ